MRTSNFLEEVRKLCKSFNLDPDKFGGSSRFEKVPMGLDPTPVNLTEIQGFKKPFVKELEYLGQIVRNLLSQIEDDRENQKINDISKNIIDYMDLILQIEMMVTKTRRKFVVYNGFIYEEKTKK